MKRFVSLCLVFMLLTLGVAAAENSNVVYWSGDWRYRYVTSNTVEIAGYVGDDTTLHLPDQLSGMNVVRIGDWAFSKAPGVTTVIIPNGISDISEYAFDDCSVTSVRVSVSHPTIEIVDNVIYHKTDRSLIYYPSYLSNTHYDVKEGTRRIRTNAFSLCSNLRTIGFPESLTVIDPAAITWCENLTRIVLPESVTLIDVEAFAYNSSLTSVTIPASVVEIGMFAFSGCSTELSFVVEPGSYAERYAVDKGIRYSYPPSPTNTPEPTATPTVAPTPTLTVVPSQPTANAEVASEYGYADALDLDALSTDDLLALANSLAVVLDERGYVLTITEKGTPTNVENEATNQATGVRGQVFTYQHDKWDLYKATFVSDTIVKIEGWYRFNANDETPFKLDHGITTINIADESTDFCWLNDARTAFSITIEDDDNSRFQEPRQVVFAVEGGTGTPAYTYMHDKWDLYKATVYSDIVVVEGWYRFNASEDPFVLDHGVCVLRMDDPNSGFAWLDDSHTSFCVTLSDKENSRFTESQMVVFTLEK